jgi:response regulator RpfG family c-di-GMP phosphodiesterase
MRQIRDVADCYIVVDTKARVQLRHAMEENRHILVVDDHRDIREPLAAYLKKHGFRVTSAANSVTALVVPFKLKRQLEACNPMRTTIMNRGRTAP